MRPYEVMFILDPVAVADDAVDSYIQRFTALLAEHGGQVTGVDKWGKRRFAYEIKGRTEGYYVVMTFQASREAVAELNRVMRITDHLIRHIVVRRDEFVKAGAAQPEAAAEAPAASSDAAEQAQEAPSGEPAAQEGAAESGEAVAAEAAEAAETTT
ncbi:MAG: 30S ribosomal protein S6 [Firmicutes bacterium]|nr:30S ribosomal protein S6 [Bacillota bacterium]MBO2521140.1 30S ribosomal protein S6 [Bacillota bacterium]